jgi:hypothetical protein
MLIYLIEKLPSDIQNIIGDFLSNKSKCRFNSTIVNKSLERLDLKYITNIKIVNENEGKFLTDKILLQPKFLKLVKIDIENNNVTNLNRFKKLTEINICCDCCEVGDAGICELENLRIINSYSNEKIKNLNRFKKLTEIYIGYGCKVNDAGICELDNLLIINANYNEKITNLNRFKKLTEINIDGWDCGVDDAGICELDNLLIINAFDNQKITNLNRFKKLTEIAISWNCGVDGAGICELENLLIINASYNPKITNLNRFKKLTEINISRSCGFGDAGICELENLQIINASHNPKITNLNRFKKLTEINIGNDCGVNDAGICELSSLTNSREAVENLQIINASGNPKITNLNRFKKLTEINIGNDCGVNDAGICELSSSTNSRKAVENLLIIQASGNTKITNLNRFKKLTEINIGWSCGVDDAGICELENLLIIQASGNTKITNLVRSTA